MNTKLRKISISVSVFAVLLVLAISSALFFKNNINNLRGQFVRGIATSLVSPVLAEDVYPLFFCPCCGQPLDKKNICCGMAQERIDYIDSLVSPQKLSEKEIVLAYVKKYGLNSFVDKNKQAETRNWLAESAPAERPVISLTPESYDLGNVSLARGIITVVFELKNEGKKDLTVNKLDTSCGCTSAAIVFNGEEGPRFAMAGHGINNPTNWEVIIPSGESAKLKVYYDPSVHLDLRGAVTREILVFSNDPINFEEKVRIELNQVD